MTDGECKWYGLIADSSIEHKMGLCTHCPDEVACIQASIKVIACTEVKDLEELPKYLTDDTLVVRKAAFKRCNELSKCSWRRKLLRRLCKLCKI